MKTTRLNLVRLTQEHAPGYHAIWSDSTVTRWSPHGVCKTLQASEEWLSGLLPEKNPLGENYAVFLRDDIDINSITKENQRRSSNVHDQDILKPGFLLGILGTWGSDPVPELGYLYNRQAWGYGFATEALSGFLEIFWKRRPQFDVLEAYCDTDNQASEKVLRKCGFELVETLSGNYELPWMEPSLRNSFRFRVTRHPK